MRMKKSTGIRAAVALSAVAAGAVAAVTLGGGAPASGVVPVGVPTALAAHASPGPTLLGGVAPSPSAPAAPVSTVPAGVGQPTPGPSTNGSVGGGRPASAPALQASTVAPLPVPGDPKTQRLSVQLQGLPSTLKVGGPAVEFTAVISNPTATGYPAVAPLFQVVGGPCNCSDGSLQLLDPSTGAWRDAKMPSGDGGSPVSFAGSGTALPAHGSLTYHYRLALSAHNSAKDAFAMLYAIDTTAHQELALSSAPSRITTG